MLVNKFYINVDMYMMNKCYLSNNLRVSESTVFFTKFDSESEEYFSPTSLIIRRHRKRTT